MGVMSKCAFEFCHVSMLYFSEMEVHVARPNKIDLNVLLDMIRDLTGKSTSTSVGDRWLAKALNVNRRTISRYLGKLEDLGYIEKTTSELARNEQGYKNKKPGSLYRLRTIKPLPVDMVYADALRTARNDIGMAFKYLETLEQVLAGHRALLVKIAATFEMASWNQPSTSTKPPKTSQWAQASYETEPVDGPEQQKAESPPEIARKGNPMYDGDAFVALYGEKK